MTTEGASVESQLDLARKQLLDLGLRNPLLNYRLLKARGVEIVDELPTEVFRTLVTLGKRMSFLPLPESDESGESAQPEESLEAAGLAARHTDSRLQTSHPSDNLQSRLLNSHYEANTFIEEQGVNILYLALGMLTWFEADSSTKENKAPLILVPVQLERGSALERFHVRYTDDDVSDNPSLVEKLRVDFGIALPRYDEDSEIAAHFAAVAAAVASQKRWSVNVDAVALGFFSFGKFLMYRDLDSEVWPDGNKPGDNPILQALLQPQTGFGRTPIEFDEESSLDRQRPVETLKHIVDADSSQAMAILQAAGGHSMAIQGPPGTGKSQTITNLVADALGAGKTVLFVSEKMAALEVVYRRLTTAGLGSACLELHSHKTKKKALLDELKRALAQDRPGTGDLAAQCAELEASRTPLNDYADAMNTPIGLSARTPYQALGESLLSRKRLQALGAPLLDTGDLASVDESQFKQKHELLRRLQQVLGTLGDPTASLFWGTRRTALSPIEQQQIAGRLELAVGSIDRVVGPIEQISGLLTLPVDATRQGAERLIRASECFDTMPAPLLIDASRDDWVTQAGAIHSLIEQGARLTTLRRELEAVMLPEAWLTPVAELREQLASSGSTWWRRLSAGYRAARVRVRALCSSPPASLAETLALLDKIIEAQKLRPLVEGQTIFATSLFGGLWQGLQSDWAAMAARANWAASMHADVRTGALPAAFLASLHGGSEAPIASIQAERKHLVTALLDHDKVVAAARTAIGLELPSGADNLPIRNTVFADEHQTFHRWQAGLSQLPLVINFNNLLAQCRNEGLGRFAELSLSWSGAQRGMADLFEHTWCIALFERALRERPALAEFEREHHEATVERFRAADKRILHLTQAELSRGHWESLPHLQDTGQLGVLRREFEKKTRFMPIRQLMMKAGNVVQAIKPVFMMSPLSIANFLPPGSLSFDVVIFDEASQVKPVDAFGAIQRGKQVIVVGDDRQLPPTSFFDKVTSEADAEEEEQTTFDIESILGLFRAQGAPNRMLHWHYRSRHESLIAVSNQEFYDNKLIIFPSPDRDKADAGLRFHYLPDTTYDRSHSRTNRGEAAAVAAAVMRHARQTPKLTLGVAAFSMAQRQAIADELELPRRKDRDAEAFFNDHPAEPFFIKNLENVQGDERDVILISIGYGKSTDGKLTMSFGPLNQQGGERRLNVLISRARLRCEVFSNITADDLRVDATTPFGVRALKLFLDYAQNGVLTAQVPADREPDSPFEIEARERLIAAGHEVAIQVGTAGYFVDLAIVDPERSGRYILGIECDGATYHSAKSARDRDRLRQEVLERLGWRIHRIWSTDWFRDPEHEIRRIEERLEALRNEVQRVSPPAMADGSTNDDLNTPAVGVLEFDGPVLARSTPGLSNNGHDQADAGHSLASNGHHEPGVGPALPRYVTATLDIQALGYELHTVPYQELLPYVVRVVETEGPVHVGEVSRRIIDALGVQRRGARIQQTFLETFALGVRQGRLRQMGEFLWPPAMSEPILRDRALAADSTRRLEMIAPEEIALAVLRVVASSYGMEPAELPAATCRILGFQRVSEDMRLRVEGVVSTLVTEGRLVRQGEHLVVR